jgi:hypothetical protein
MAKHSSTLCADLNQGVREEGPGLEPQRQWLENAEMLRVPTHVQETCAEVARRSGLQRMKQLFSRLGAQELVLDHSRGAFDARGWDLDGLTQTGCGQRSDGSYALRKGRHVPGIA